MNNINSTLDNATITVKLQKQNGVDANNEPVWVDVGEAIILSKPWTHEWSDQDKYDAQGNLINYRVIETEAKVNATDSLDITDPQVATAEDDTKPYEFTLVNTLPDTSITVTKEWKIGNTAITWPENTTVTVGLYRKTGEGDPVAVMEGSTQKTVVLDASNPSSTFSGLPVYDNSGVEYTYSVKEIAVNKVVNGTTVAIDTSTHTTSPVTFGLTTITIEETAVGENTDTTEGAAPLAASITNTLGDISLKVIKVEKGTTTQLNGAKFQLT